MTAAGLPFTDPWTTSLTGLPLPEQAQPFRNNALMIATELLWANSGRRFGTSSVTVRPCARYNNGWADWTGLPWLMSFMSDAWSMWPGSWLLPLPFCGGVGCGGCDGCSTPPLHQIDLVKTPVSAVTSVTVDGVELPSDGSAYRVDSWRYLVRVDGGHWPRTQNLALPATEPDTWEVAFQWGQPPPLVGQLACGEFAREIALYLAGDKNCRIPWRASSVTRQGVTIPMVPFQEFLATGHTGLLLTDAFLVAYNRHGITSRAHVYRADAPERGRVVNT